MSPLAVSSARRGFTMIEITIALGVFLVIGAAMVMILIQATRIYQSGEYSRVANDEAVTVLASLQGDLDRILPPGVPIVAADGTLQPAPGGGWMYSAVTDKVGNCLIAFATRNPNRNQITETGERANLLVAYWVQDGDSDGQQRLMRWSSPLFGDARDDAGGQNPGAKTVVRRLAADPNVISGSATAVSVLTAGCLHFGAWIATQEIAAYQRPRGGTQDDIDWEATLADGRTRLLPQRTSSFDSAPPQQPLQPFPSALRLSLDLTGGGRFAPRGELKSHTPAGASDEFRFFKMADAALIPGTPVRIGDEWLIAGAGSSSNRLITVPSSRGQRRSQIVTQHQQGAIIRIGRSFSLVRAMPK